MNIQPEASACDSDSEYDASFGELMAGDDNVLGIIQYLLRLLEMHNDEDTRKLKRLGGGEDEKVAVDEFAYMAESKAMDKRKSGSPKAKPIISKADDRLAEYMAHPQLWQDGHADVSNLKPLQLTWNAWCYLDLDEPE